jgi:hypothetical protein
LKNETKNLWKWCFKILHKLEVNMQNLWCTVIKNQIEKLTPFSQRSGGQFEANGEHSRVEGGRGRNLRKTQNLLWSGTKNIGLIFTMYF